MKIKIFYLTLAIALCANMLYGMSINNKTRESELIERLNNKFNDVKTFIADTELINERRNGKEDTIIGKTYYKKPNMWRGEMNSIHQNSDVNPGITVRNSEYKLIYIPVFNMAYKYDFKKENEVLGPMQEFANMMGINTKVTVKYITSYVENRKEIHVFEGILEGGDEKIILKYYNDTGLAKELRMEDNGEVSILKFKNIKINVPLDDMLFYLELPKSVNVINVTDKRFKKISPEEMKKEDMCNDSH